MVVCLFFVVFYLYEDVFGVVVCLGVIFIDINFVYVLVVVGEVVVWSCVFLYFMVVLFDGVNNFVESLFDVCVGFCWSFEEFVMEFVSKSFVFCESKLIYVFKYYIWIL